jgi:integrase/recombinase XerD
MRLKTRLMSSDSQAAIDRFVDAVWLEDGLSANTLAAYRRDLAAFAEWLSLTSGVALHAVHEMHLQAYFAARHSLSKATSANRRLTVFKRYYRWALRERIVELDPTLRMLAAKQALRVPKTLSEDQVNALLMAPDENTALGLRDKAMLELLYASGLRVSELVKLKTLHVSLNEGVLRIMGKGSKERLVPFGDMARDSLLAYMQNARGALLGLKQTEDLFVTASGPGTYRDNNFEVQVFSRPSAAARRYPGEAGFHRRREGKGPATCVGPRGWPH